MTQTIFRWEQDGSGGEHGTATYFPSLSHEVTVTMPSFSQAHALQQSIEAALLLTRLGARRELLAQIARIAP